MRTVHFITGNPAKIAWAKEQCDKHGITVIHEALPLTEIQADTVQEVALAKARAAHALLGGNKAVVVEDGGLIIPALNNFPGPYSKYVLGTLGIEGILKLMEGLQGEARYAYYDNTVTFIDENGAEKQFVSTGYKGHIDTKIWSPSDKPMWSEVWRIFIALNFDRAMSTFSEADWQECYRVNDYKPVFTAFAEWYGSAAEAA